MNKVTHAIINGDSVFALVFLSDKFGRTLVFYDQKYNPVFGLEIRTIPDGEIVKELDFVEYIHSMLPPIPPLDLDKK